MVAQALTSGEETRSRISARMKAIVTSGLPSESELRILAEALWEESHLDDFGIPRGTQFADWVFLFLPEPTPGIADTQFRRKWLPTLDRPVKNGNDPWRILFEVGNAIGNLPSYGRSFDCLTPNSNCSFKLPENGSIPQPKSTPAFQDCSCSLY